MRKDCYKINHGLEMSKNQKGVTLVEALVTLLVISIGALGMASMQLAGLKYSSGSYGRTQAVILADDMANRLKSNREQALSAAPGAYGAIQTFGAATPALAADCSQVSCTPDQLAAFDVVAWRNELARVLPSGQGQITTTPINVVGANGTNTTQTQYNISVQWRQVASSTSDVDSTNAVNFNPDEELRNFTFRILL